MTRTVAQEYREIRDSIMKGMGWGTDKADTWMKTKNPHFGETSPQQLIAIGRGHKVKAFVEAQLQENLREPE